MNDLRLILFGIIIIVFCLSFASVLVSVIRRAGNKWRYDKLDGLREKFRPEILRTINSGSIDSIYQFVNTSKIRVGSLEWVALEYILFELSEDEEQKKYTLKLFDEFGYTKYYHNQLLSRGSSIKLSTAADKLGRIGDPSAVEPLVNLLNHKKSEVVTVAMRALCRIGTNDALHHVLFFLPTLRRDSRVSLKVIQTSLLLLGPWAGDMLLNYACETHDPEILAVILETLVTFPARRETTKFALTTLSHPDAEVRAKALRVIARGGIEAFSYEATVFLPLLNDPVWFVRLQTAKTIGEVKCENAVEMLKTLALDEQWQVRDAATLSLVELGDESLDAFLELLETRDRYAKESISEEIQRSGFVLDLIEYLGGADPEKKAKAERILTSMHRVGFSTPLREAIETRKSRPDIIAELTKILFSEIVA